MLSNIQHFCLTLKKATTTKKKNPNKKQLKNPSQKTPKKIHPTTEFLVPYLLKSFVFPNWKFKVKGWWKRSHILLPLFIYSGYIFRVFTFCSEVVQRVHCTLVTHKERNIILWIQKYSPFFERRIGGSNKYSFYYTMRMKYPLLVRLYKTYVHLLSYSPLCSNLQAE